MLGGVASGIADYLSIDVTLVRVLFVLAIFVPHTFPIVLAYIAMWIVMPTKKPNQEPLSLQQPTVD